MTDIPVVVTAAGAQPTPPAELLAALLIGVSAVRPGYTANLPGSMIEDMSSTEVGGLAQMDSARVELLNSLTPFSANNFMLSELGQIYIGPGSAPAVPTNTSVYVVFQAVDADDNPAPGWVIDRGFTVGDGTYQYVVQDGGVTASDGFTTQLFCQATIAGTWVVNPNTVTTIATSVPTGTTVTCTNPLSGVSGGPAETAEQYRARVMQAGQAIGTGIPTYLKTLLGEVSGVQQRLVSVVQQTSGFWSVIVGGGDPYEVAGAIYRSGLNIAGLEGSTLAVTAITQAGDGKVTTDLNHGFSVGQNAEMSGIVGMVPLNGVQFTVATVPDEKSFTIGISTSGYPAYVSGGVVTPNLRNVTPNLNDYPDIYSVPFINPPQQTVSVTATWATTADNFVSQASVSQLAAPALEAYINSITVGAPINLLVMESVFLAAIAPVLAGQLVSALTFAVSINGIATAPLSSTSLVFGDQESYFKTTLAQCVVVEA